MTTDNYNPATSLGAYYPSRTTNLLSRLWQREKTLHDWSDLGIARFFEGGGTDPTVLTGYAPGKLWLRADAGVTTTVAEVRAYIGGDATSLDNWPTVDAADWMAHTSARGRDLDLVWIAATSGDPGTGRVLGNNATLASISQINVSKTGRGGQAYADRIAAWDSGDRLVIYNLADEGKFAEFTLTAAPSDQTTYYALAVTHVASSSLTANAPVGAAQMATRAGNGATGITRVSSISALKALDTGTTTIAYLTEQGREGMWHWRSGNYSSAITADTNNGIYAKADAIASSSGSWVRERNGVAHLLWFGADPANATTGAARVANAVDVLEIFGRDVLLVPKGYLVDWEAVGLTSDRITIIDDTGAVIIGNVALSPSRFIPGNVTFQTRRSVTGITRVYAQPMEWSLGQPEYTDVATSFTAFFDDYDNQGYESTLPGSDWTGPHYRDGGVSCVVGNLFHSDIFPAGAVLFNSKMGGNWWPFRPVGGLSVSERQLVSVAQMLPHKAKAGPTFAGGRGYTGLKRWAPNMAVSSGDLIFDYGRVYEVTTGGTTGNTPPIHDGVGGQPADAWDASILTTVGTLSSGFYYGSDGGGVVQYALIDRILGVVSNLDEVVLLGEHNAVDPLIGLGDHVQVLWDMIFQRTKAIKFAKGDADGVGTLLNHQITADLNDSLVVGNPSGARMTMRSAGQTQFLNTAIEFSRVSKPDGDTTMDISAMAGSVIGFNDTSATSFTGFTGRANQVFFVNFGTNNTTLVESSTLQLGGGGNWTPTFRDGATFVMNTSTQAQLIGRS